MPKPYNSQKLASEILSQNPILYQKIAIACNLEPTEIDKILVELLKFLWLVGGLNQKLTPSYLVDNAWHEFILCTRLYHRFCEKYFSRYIHHSPGGDEIENHRNFKRTIQLYILHFGEPAEKFWGSMAKNEWLDAQCGSCTN